jgi:hypothetical protein
MTAAQKPSFGFGNLSEAISEIRPTGPVPVAREPAPQEIDRVGERLGFTSREPSVRRRRRQAPEEPTDQLNLRASIPDINRFVEWCERNRFSYREGFAALVKRIDQA